MYSMHKVCLKSLLKNFALHGTEFALIFSVNNLAYLSDENVSEENKSILKMALDKLESCKKRLDLNKKIALKRAPTFITRCHHRFIIV